MRPTPSARKPSNRAIIGTGIALCIALAVFLAWFFDLLA
jgi:hypothetical protein